MRNRPLGGAPAVPEWPRTEDAVGEPRRETILLVEDARRVREVVREILE